MRDNVPKRFGQPGIYTGFSLSESFLIFSVETQKNQDMGNHDGPAHAAFTEAVQPMVTKLVSQLQAELAQEEAQQLQGAGHLAEAAALSSNAHKWRKRAAKVTIAIVNQQQYMLDAMCRARH